MGERERERQTDKLRETDTERQRETDRETERARDRQTDRRREQKKKMECGKVSSILHSGSRFSSTVSCGGSLTLPLGSDHRS